MTRLSQPARAPEHPPDDRRGARPPAEPAPTPAATTRAAVHAASGKRLGAARPRQEGPSDLRLVAPAL
ncbi:hypothetical protein NGM37_40175, partial [Streptomyces sp. TRM76130]|nr:hypothetical protein [Streptomyces sp. TRM76130]